MLTTPRRKPRAARLKHAWRPEALVSLGVRAVKKLLRPLLEIDRFVFFETDLTGRLPSAAARPWLDVRVASAEDLEALADDLQQAGVSRAEARRRLAIGHAAIVAMAGGELAHVHWLAFAPCWIDEIGVALEVAPGEAYGYDAFTLPRWRGHGVHPAVSAFLNRYEVSRGCTRHVSYVRADNAPSLRVMRKVGRRPTRTLLRLRVAGMGRPLVLGAAAMGSPALSCPRSSPR